MSQFDLKKVWTSVEHNRNPQATWTAMLEQGPLLRAKLPVVGEIWMTTTYEAASAVLKDHKTFARDQTRAGKTHQVAAMKWLPRSFTSIANSMLTKDEPEHRRLRGLVEQAFVRQSVEAMRPRLIELADRYLDELEVSTTHGQSDFVAHFSRPFPLAVICELLGLPMEDRPTFMAWGERLARIRSGWSFLRAIPGMFKLKNYLVKQIQIVRKNPRPGVLSALVEAEHEGSQLNDEELLGMAFLLFGAGHETTVHLLNSSIVALQQFPDARKELCEDWSLATGTVHEVLRYMSPVEFSKPRFITTDMEFHGQQIKRGELIMPCLGSSNFDPAKFDQPEMFDIHRSPNPHLTFGVGIHTCLGLKLAVAETETAVRRTYERFPEFQLAVPIEQIDWLGRMGMRAVGQLPVRLK